LSVQRRATYRLQLTADFGFDRVAEVADYLAALGVSHLYTSPYLQAAPGSTHGYDVVDHSRLSDELGGSEAHARMIAALKAAGLGHLVDTVPNHPRLTQSLPGGWGETTLTLPGGGAVWRNVLTQDAHRGRERVANLLARFPVALLVKDQPDAGGVR
jgi:maltooligosyltrehalose synthase